jgi:eukaryotic-like serine/threonine-protein kinase
MMLSVGFSDDAEETAVGNQTSPEAESLTRDCADRIATEFKEALKRSERPSIRAELGRAGPDVRVRLLTELIGLDIVYRRRAGESASPADYECDFPEMSELTPAERAEMIDWIDRSMHENTSAVPTQIGAYPILAVLDKGGQAWTFRAFHPRLQTTVVLKLALRPAEPGSTDRIAAEGRLLASLPVHPNLVKIYDVDFYEGRVYLVLEDVPGSTLAQYAKGRPLDVKWAAKTVAAIARAVQVAHDHGVTHQDLKPSNVLIDSNGAPRVIDFGVAWRRSWWVESDDAASIGGTLHFFSPEQARLQGDRIGPATDVFGLGGILYSLLTSKMLYQGENRLDVLHQAREAEFDREALTTSSIPAPLREICLKALATEPCDRYASAAGLAKALERYIAPRRWVYPALLALLFLLAFGAGLAIQHYLRPAMTDGEQTGRPRLEVRIWRPGTDFLPLLQALPVKSGDEMQVRFRAAKGNGVSIFFLNPSGRLQLLKQFPAAEIDGDVAYPETGKAQELRGPAGTEMVVAIAGSDVVTVGELQRLWDSSAEAGPLPLLSGASIARLTTVAVDFQGERSRDVGEIHDRSDPQEKIRRRLDELRKKLKTRASVFEGVVFSRQ